FYVKTEPFFRWMESTYESSLGRFMKARWISFVLIAGCFAIMYFIYSALPSELAPMEDRNQFRLQVTAPEGTAYEYMDSYIDKLSQFMQDSIPEKQIIMSLTAPGFGGGAANTGFVRVVLKNPAERQRSQQDVVDMVNKNL